MELLDRYLEAVRKHLPWKRQNDILAELRANLEAQLEDRESSLGRPLTQGEAEDWLRSLGAPIQVAAPYQPQQYLIGPRLFPVYLAVLKVALPWIFAIYIIIWAVQIFASSAGLMPAIGIAISLPWSLFLSVGVITMIFAVIEFLTLHFPERFPQLKHKVEDWSPAELPPVPKQSEGPGKPRTLAQAIAEVVFGALFLAWWLLVPHYPYLLFGPGAFFLRALPVDFSPVFRQFYWCVAVLNLVQLIWHAVDLGRGAWQRRSRMEHMVSSILGIVPLVLLLSVSGHAYVFLRPGATGTLTAAQLATANQFMHFSISLVLAIQAAQLAWSLGRHLVAVYQRRAAA